eukprot:361645_1
MNIFKVTSSILIAIISNQYYCTSKEIICYYANWEWDARNNLVKPENLDFNKCTIVNYAFFQSDFNGYLYGTHANDSEILFGFYDSINDPNAVNYKCHHNAADSTTCSNHQIDTGLIFNVHQAGGKIFPSLGG